MSRETLIGVPAVVQQVKDPALSLQQLPLAAELAGLIPGLARWVKDPVLLQWWCRS